MNHILCLINFKIVKKVKIVKMVKMVIRGTIRDTQIPVETQLPISH